MTDPVFGCDFCKGSCNGECGWLHGEDFQREYPRAGCVLTACVGLAVWIVLGAVVWMVAL
jgi:hypothetical protein